MTFQILDDRRECFGIYNKGEFIYDRVPTDATRTWTWNPNLDNRSIDFACVYVGGKSIDDVCPDHLKQRFEKREAKIKAFVNSATNAKMKMSEHCLFDMIPEQHLKHYCEIKNEICNYVFENYDKPINHQYIVDLYEMASDISQNDVLINQEVLKKASKYDAKARALVNFLNGENKPICYDVWGSKTGRLTTKKGSFPIMNLKKELADCVIPKNHAFVQFDLNGAEIRTLLSLSTGAHPREDIHEWNIKNVYGGKISRDDAKKRFFAWLYNPNSKDEAIAKAYDREQILKKYYSNAIVSTPLGREIESDDFHALNYLLQSTSSDNCMKQCVKVNKFLRNTKSFVHSVVHDSLTIDLDLADRQLLPQIQEIFEDTQLGWFRSSVHAGRNLKDLEAISWS